ncbi:indolepyruvate ferredoxin oxidoreductase family protein [Ramlibacter sp. G-1-2-2]|uniref:Indolepyruvate ferredoxin oxidoreductase family protein n=1 Tax=Ramlibacter agri TaxID=2728837 RepID=A0A848H9U1_9BURK|nr:indolepyruvate ferredoxin oxidoreductase family protein [Ramlibacter agri]NML47254.1 indolepyruvate ferredoxin oxidoreductase family protein [Ramlibacter agri]
MNAPTEAKYLLTLQDRYTVEEGRIYLNGMQALVRLMLDQHRADRRNGLDTAGLVSGYPGSPVGGVDDEMLANRELLAQHQVVFQPGLNEELAATAIFGSQTLQSVPEAKHDGVYGLWYGKSPGVDRAADAFRHANFRGVGRNGGVLCVAGDDPHARSTIYPSDSNLVFASFLMPVLAPGNIQEVLDFGLHGYALSRASGLWVGFKLVTDVADSCASALVGPERVQPVLPQVEWEGKPFAPALRVNEAGPPMLQAERQIVGAQLEVAREYARLNGLNRITVNPPQARIGLLTGGKTYYDLRQALHDLGLDDAALEAAGIRILTLGMLYPVEPGIVQEFARGLDEIIVVEDKRAFLELALKDLLYAGEHRPAVVGKHDELGRDLFPAHGELSADVIARVLRARLGAKLALTAPCAQAARGIIPVQAIAGRTPYFCSGCPHNRSLRVPEGSVVGAGIGCHVMALWMGNVFGNVTGYTQMGGEGAQWVGLAPFTGTKHFFQNLGDGTFHHSGSLAIRFAIAAGTNITYKVLYNKAVAMTGGQDVTGAMSVPAMVEMLRAEGVKRVIVTTDEPQKYAGGKAASAEVWHRDRLVEAEEALAATPGVTVLINDQQCAAEKRRLRRRGKLEYKPKTVFINERVCEGCGDCGRKSNCLSVQPVATEFGRKTQIHQSSCNQDFSCLDGDCPSFLTVEAAGSDARPPKRQAVPFPSDVLLPAPVSSVIGEHFSACLMGIGGTGVVTVNQILGTAAFLDGRKVQTYDHTGSSQKGGAVISHLKILPQGEDAAPTLSKGSADLYLAFDALVGVNADNLSLAAPERTIAVVSTTQVPTGQMVSDVAASRYPALDALAERIAAASRAERNVFLDAQHVAERLLGDHMASNLLLVGVAWQLGALPIRAEAIEAAIRLNGVQRDMNLAAFRWGRLYVADQARVEAALREDKVAAPVLTLAPEAQEIIDSVGASGALLEALRIRVPELIAYQDAAYARRYAEVIARVRQAGPDALALAVARNLYKLMAIKDEYEVARLHLEPAAQQALQASFGPGARIAWHFHPTFLRSLGVKKKLKLGAWFRPALQVLRAMKAVRGTSLDFLGMTRVRRVERALVPHYLALVDALLPRLDAGTLPLALELAEAPDMVRGYEDVKLANVTAYLARMDHLQRQLGLRVPLAPELAGSAFDPVATTPASA